MGSLAPAGSASRNGLRSDPLGPNDRTKRLKVFARFLIINAYDKIMMVIGLSFPHAIAGESWRP